MVKRNLLADFGTGRRAKRARVSRPSAKSYIAKTARQAVIRMAEKKVAITSLVESPVGSGAQGTNFVGLSNLSQGTGHGERVGREVRLTSIKIGNVLHNNSSGTHLVRVVLGVLKDQTIPGNTTEFLDGGLRSSVPYSFVQGGNQGIAQLLAPINTAKFSVLYDRVHRIGAQATLDGTNTKLFNIYKKLNHKIKFEANTSGVSNQDKQLYIAAWTAEGADDASTGTTVEWHMQAELKYIDL